MRRLILFSLAFLAVGCTEISGDPSAPAVVPSGDLAVVVSVGDGDSLIVEIDGVEENIRLIGINAPERDECYGPEAKARLETLVLNRRVTLVTDEESEDQYGRMLRYVYLEDGSLVNERLTADGFVMARSYPPNTARQSDLARAQDRARQTGAGMWADGACAVASDLSISDLQADAPGPDDENLNGEWIEITNGGTEGAILSGWSLRDAESVNRYSFPSGASLGPGDNLRVVTGCGDDTTTQVHWCSPGPVWNNKGDVAFLLDPEGRIADRFEY